MDEKDKQIIAQIFKTENTDVFFFEHMLVCMEQARSDEKRKAAEEIFKEMISEGQNCVYGGCKRIAIYVDENGDRYCNTHRKKDEKEADYKFERDECLKERILWIRQFQRKYLGEQKPAEKEKRDEL